MFFIKCEKDIQPLPPFSCPTLCKTYPKVITKLNNLHSYKYFSMNLYICIYKYLYVCIHTFLVLVLLFIFYYIV